MCLYPDVVEYDRDKLKRPLFDLIIGVQTMDELGIILNFKEQEITIDEIALPILTSQVCHCLENKDYRLQFNSLARSLEPKSTELATQRVVRILDAIIRKQIFQKLLKLALTYDEPKQTE